jgi:hypothetical protein
VRYNTRRVTNNTKQGLIVSIGFLVVLIAIGAVMMINFGRREHAYALSLVKGSLEQERLKAFAGKSNTVNQGEFLITPAELATALRDTTLYISKVTVKSMSTDIVCAMPISDNSAYAIDANGRFRELSKEEFARWPHVSVQEAQKTDAR